MHINKYEHYTKLHGNAAQFESLENFQNNHYKAALQKPTLLNSSWYWNSDA